MFLQGGEYSGKLADFNKKPQNNLIINIVTLQLLYIIKSIVIINYYRLNMKLREYLESLPVTANYNIELAYTSIEVAGENVEGQYKYRLIDFLRAQQVDIEKMQSEVTTPEWVDFCKSTGHEVDDSGNLVNPPQILPEEMAALQLIKDYGEEELESLTRVKKTELQQALSTLHAHYLEEAQSAELKEGNFSDPKRLSKLDAKFPEAGLDDMSSGQYVEALRGGSAMAMMYSNKKIFYTELCEAMKKVAKEIGVKIRSGFDRGKD